MRKSLIPGVERKRYNDATYNIFRDICTTDIAADPIEVSLLRYAESKYNNSEPMSISRLEGELFGGVDSMAAREFWTDAMKPVLKNKVIYDWDNEYRALLFCLFATMPTEDRYAIVLSYFNNDLTQRANANRSAI